MSPSSTPSITVILTDFSALVFHRLGFKFRSRRLSLHPYNDLSSHELKSSH